MKKKDIDKSIMKKNGFVQGAFIATIGIVLAKVLGILYVIPFYSIIGEKGGALYGYAYSIYLVFMAISSAGIPLAISKITSEYQTLGNYEAKERAFFLGKKIAVTLGIISFIILFIFAKPLAIAIIGDLKGGNTIEEVTYVIRVISTAILVVPILSIYRGYFEGHKFITPTAISQVLEQIVRVLIIIIGSFIALKLLHIQLYKAVGIALLGATLGSSLSYIYLLLVKKYHEKKFKKKSSISFKDKITDQEIIRKIIIYSFPLVMIDIFKSLYSVVDTVTVVKTLGPIYGTIPAESIMSILSTWGAKFNMIIIAISTGMVVSLIPNLTSSVVVGNMKDVHNKINQCFQILLYLVLPMTIGLSFLAEPVYTLFYGPSEYGPTIFAFNIFVALATALFTTAITIVQVLKYYKVVFVSLISGLLLKILINVSLMKQLYGLGMPAYYGPIISSILGYTLSLIICLVALNIKCGVSYEKTINQGINTLCGTIIMVMALVLTKFIVPIIAPYRVLNIFVIIIYTLIGGGVYLLYMKLTGSNKEIFKNKIKLH